MPDEFKTTVATYIAMLCEAFARKPTKAMFMAYEAGLQGLSSAQLKVACLTSLQQNRQFMPSPGELRELGLSDGVGFESVSSRAWDCLCGGIRLVGSSGSPNFEDALINAVVRHFGGWERVCGMPTDEFEKWFRKDFEKIYLQLLRTGCSEDLRRPLVGSIERENSVYHGLPNPRTGRIYELPAVVSVPAGYAPRVPSLPAPERKLSDVPQIEFKRPPAAEADPPKRVSRIIKKDFSKHLNWNDKADLEFQLTPEQLEAQEENRRKLLQLKGT